MFFIYLLLIGSVLTNEEHCSEEYCQLPSCQCPRIGENPTWLEIDELPQLVINRLIFVG